jgi:hypothetical protein
MKDSEDLNDLFQECDFATIANPFKSQKGRRPTSSSDFYDEEEEQGYLSSYVHWTTAEGRIFVPAAPTVEVLTPGVYEIKQSSALGLYFEKIPVRTEGLLQFPDTNSDRVVSEIQKFWERESIFVDYGLIYKRGILLYGPPGSGKSCTIQLIMEDVVQRNGIVIKFSDPYLFIDGMRVLRQIQPNTPVVVILEDIDSTLQMFNESEILNILDGVNEVKKIVFLATTNYPEKLGARIVNRPSRFDKRFRIGYPTTESRKMYFEFLIGGGNPDKLAQKVKELDLNIDQWVEDTEDMSIAHLKELFVQVVIIGDPYEEAINTLKGMKEEIVDKEYSVKMGFTTTPNKRNTPGF